MHMQIWSSFRQASFRVSIYEFHFNFTFNFCENYILNSGGKENKTKQKTKKPNLLTYLTPKFIR